MRDIDKHIRLNSEENNNWDSKSIHRLLKLPKNDQGRALDIFEKISKKDVVLKVYIP